MNELINSLTQPIVEYDAEGLQHTKPPTSIMLRASRALKELATINETNNIMIAQFTNRNHMLEVEVEHLRKEIQDAQRNIAERSAADNAAKSTSNEPSSNQPTNETTELPSG